MRTSIFIQGILLIGLIAFTSCNISNNPNKSESVEQSIKTESSQLSSDFLGNYHGIQPSYFMKNQYGDEMIIAGNKVSVPSSDYKFLLKENNVVSLQQTNLEDNSRVFYDGTFKILNDDPETIKIECSLSDGKSSSPTYTLSLKKTDKKGICTGSNEPEFTVELLNLSQ